MKTISLVLKELFGLFVDDGSLAIAILVLAAAIALLLHVGWLSPLLGGGLLLIGLIGLLSENLLRSVRSFKKGG